MRKLEIEGSYQPQAETSEIQIDSAPADSQVIEGSAQSREQQE